MHRATFLLGRQPLDFLREGTKAQRRDVEKKGLLYIVPSRLRAFSLKTGTWAPGSGRERSSHGLTSEPAADWSRKKSEKQLPYKPLRL